MFSIYIKIDKKYKEYLSDDSELQSLLTELVMDYVEQKKYMKTRNNLFINVKFNELNSKLESKIWK